MKRKNVVAIGISVGIIVSCFGGVYAGVAKEKFSYTKYDPVLNQSKVGELPRLNVVKVEPSRNKEMDMPVQRFIIDTEEKEKVLYEGTIKSQDTKKIEMFQTGKKEINRMLDEGYSIEDIIEADRIGNELGIEPEELLIQKDEKDQSLKVIRKNILKNSRKQAIDELKKEHKEEYTKLKKENMKEIEIYKFLSFVDSNNIKISDKLIVQFQTKGDKIFREMNWNQDTKVTEKTKKKYKISNESTERLSEEMVEKIEQLSEKTGESVNKLCNSYCENIKNKKNRKN